MIEVIDNHSVRTDLLTGGPVLDAGARGFVFSKWFADRGHEVWAVDPAPDIKPPNLGNNFILIRKGIASRTDTVPQWYLNTLVDPGAAFLTTHNNCGPAVEVNTLDTFLQGEIFDVVKLNVEGAEYGILNEWRILRNRQPRQIVVSFHEHTRMAQGRAECDRLIDKMRKWYTPIQHVWDERYCAGFNYWDTVLVRNDLV